MRNANSNTESGNKKDNILDKMYGRLIKEKLRTISEEDEERWYIYDTILYELKREHNYQSYDEIKYRLTDGENPNEVFYDIILRGDYSSSLIWLFKKKIEEFIEDDKYNRFLD
ncbi:MAG: hypothetical protein KDC82_08500 [Bacteroidetes bacterium]|nr:hypothetical protein [Bacteroidota bacterium]